MEENMNQLLNILNDFIEKYPEIKDIEIVKNVVGNLLQLQKNNINLDKLEKNIIYLDTNYDELNEISYYFTPIIISIKKEKHKKMIDELRINNKIKKENK